MTDNRALLDVLSDLVEEGLEAGLSYTEAAMPAVDYLKRNGLEAEFIQAHGAVVIGYLYRQRNSATRSTRINDEPPKDRMNVKTLRGGVFSVFMHVGDGNVRIGDLTKRHCLIIAKEYRQQASAYERLAKFWNTVAIQLGSAVRVRDQWREATFAERLKKAENDGA